MSRHTTSEIEFVDLAGEEGIATFDQLARREMHISGAEFLRRWDAGEWANIDMDEVPGLVDVWMGLPLVR